MTHKKTPRGYDDLIAANERDIARYLAEQNQVLLRLSTIYAGFENDPVGAFAASEPEIVEQNRAGDGA